VIINPDKEIVSRELFALFQKYSDKKFVFIEPGGNWGDYLIYKGAYKLAQLVKLDYSILTYSEYQNTYSISADIVYIHGGGGFVPWWTGKPANILNKLSANFHGTLILGPTTYFNDDDYIKKIFYDCFRYCNYRALYVFARELTSYKVVEKHLHCKSEIVYDHDTALNLVRSDIIGNQQYKGKYTLYAMRNDKELNKSQSYNYFSWLDPIGVSSSFNEWLNIHLKAKQIITNRTHSAILGAILGIPTTLLPNNYHKNRSIWEYSLRERGVEWLDSIKCKSYNDVINHMPILCRLFTSHRYKQMLRLKLNYLDF